MTDMPDVEKVSAVEGFKSESEYLLGDIGTELIDGEDFFGKSGSLCNALTFSMLFRSRQQLK